MATKIEKIRDVNAKLLQESSIADLKAILDYLTPPDNSFISLNNTEIHILKTTIKNILNDKINIYFL